jgi:hypothetical protein
LKVATFEYFPANYVWNLSVDLAICAAHGAQFVADRER